MRTMARKSKARRYEVVLADRVERGPGLSERRFWILAVGVVVISVLTQTFDFSLTPPAYRGLFITRPYCGLHDWHFSHLAWDARSHVKYGLGYTQGYCTAAVGDPPSANPLRYVSHPALDTLIIGFGMLILGTEEWEVRLFDLILSIPCLLLILFILRKLYGSSIALMSGLLWVILPVFAFFSFGLWMTLMGLWALYRYLILTGRLANAPEPKRRHFLELGVALKAPIKIGRE